MYEQCTYGTFTFDYHRMKVNQKTLYGVNGIDQIGIEYTFHIEGILSAPDETTFQTVLRTATCQLNTPRLPFTSQWSQNSGGPYTKYWDIDPAKDTGWGPKPQNLDINVIIGGRSALFTWTLITRTKQCFGENCEVTDLSLNSPILSISRRYDHAVDENGLTTRTVSGKILIHAESIRTQNRQADFYRNLSVFAVPKYFRRISENFNANEDGTEVDFSYSDKEALWTLPRPVSSGQATWRVTTRLFGNMASYMLSGKFTATTADTKADLLRQVSLLAANRFPPQGNGLTYTSTERMIEEEIYDNSIRFQISAEGPCGDLPTGAGGVGGSASGQWNMQTVYNTFGIAPPGSDSAATQGISQAIGVYGGDGNVTSGVIANTPAPYDACDPPFIPSNGGSPGSPRQFGVTNNGTITSGQVPIIPGAQDSPVGTITPQNLNISTDHASAPFVEYYEEILYSLDNHIVIFYPKVLGENPVKQQTANPSMKIVQCGYACRRGQSSRDAPELPDPVFPDAIILRSDPCPAVPVAVGNNGWNQYKIQWRYVMELPYFIDTEDLSDLVYPIDVRRPSTTAEPILRVPDFVE